jgi:hypothetical protein
MGRNKAAAGIAAALALMLGILVYTRLEIYQRIEPVPPSRETRGNPFYALEKWLSKTGHPVRIAPSLSPSLLLLAKEKSVYIQASVFDWQDGEAILVPWAEAGGALFISVEPSWYDEDEDFAWSLEAIGVRADIAETEPAEDAETGDGPGDEKKAAVPESAVILRDTENNFSFDPRLRFSLIEGFEFDDAPFVMEDAEGIARLVQIPLGQGEVTVTGRPFFMYNYNLRSKENARLSWELTAAETNEEYPGVLFVRGRQAAKSLFGKLSERGNLLPLAASALALVFIGCWMAIPGFGVLRQGEKARPRPIRDRFRAEARFFKKYHALDGYLKVYLREIKSRRLNRGKDSPIAGLEEIEAIERSLSGAGGMDCKRKQLKYGEIIRDLKILETVAHRQACGRRFLS